MRLVSLEVSGFRGFARREVIDLDADTVVVVGENGQGKTSIFDAILWAVAGQIPRLGSDKSVVSEFSESGEARVSLVGRTKQGTKCTMVRSSDGRVSRFSLQVDEGDLLRGPAATDELLKLLWPDALAATDPNQALFSAVERGVYLQQDLVRSFIDATDDKERFSTIGELVGTGRITELQRALESSRLAWTKVTTTRENERQGLRRRVEQLEQGLATPAGPEPAVPADPDGWGAWWTRAVSAGVALDPPASPDAGGAAGKLDAAIRELQLLEQREVRRRNDASSLHRDLADMPGRPGDDIKALQAQVEAAQLAASQARSDVTSAEEQAAAIRRTQVELAETREELRALAQIAIRHLDEHCPVCDQEYDRAGTKARLESRLRDAPSARALPKLPDVVGLAGAVQQKEGEVAQATRLLNDASARVREWESRWAELTGRAERLGLPASGRDVWPKELEARILTHEERLKEVNALRQEAERLLLVLVRSGERARRAEIEREVKALRSDLARSTRDVEQRQKTYDLLSKIIDGLRDASSDVVDEQLKRLAPLLQRIYATADPHPAFRVARLLSRMHRGQGRVVASIGDPFAKVESLAPETLLSSSQMNALAVSIFLALNLGMSALPLEAVILDDPLQSLDDVNLLGLIDLLRSTRERRQLLISTHDRRFASLLQRKLRPAKEGQRTVVIDLQGWSRRGPAVQQWNVERDLAPVRIAA